MKSLSFFCFLTIFTSSFVNALEYAKTMKYGSPGRIITYSCFYGFTDLGYIWGYNLNTSRMGYFFDGACAYEPAVGTILLCAANKYGPYTKKFNNTVSFIQEECLEDFKYDWKMEDLYASYDNATKFQFEMDPEVNYTGKVFYEPVSIPVSVIQNQFTFYKNDYYNLDSISLYAAIFYFFFIGVFLIHGIANLFTKWGLHIKFNQNFIKWYRAHISIPALFNEKHTEESVTLKIFSTLVPTRLESCVIFVFIALNVILTCVHYDISSTYVSRRTQLYEFIANRTGILSFGLIPLLIIFSGRNNLLISLTGIPYATFIVYHKWVARFMFIHAVIHSACWTGYGVDNGYLSYYVQRAYWQWGIVATTIAGLIVFQAFHIFRKRSYEIFLVLHIVLAALFIVGCFYHCAELGYLEWIYASCALWFADRVSRVIRILIFGIRKAKIEYVSDSTFRVTIKHNSLFSPFPGAYAFIHFMTPLQFWQAHPFTIMTSVKEANTIVMYIKTKKGITNTLKKRVMEAPDHITEMRVWVEGPYGHKSPVERYDSVLLLGGGNGIPGLFSHALDLAQRGLAGKKHVRLIWSIRNAESLLWFQDELRALRETSVQIEVFITGSQKAISFVDSKDNSSSGDNKDSSSDKDNENITVESDSKKSHTPQEVIEELSSHIKFSYARPDVDALIKEEFLVESGPSVAVVSCGPPKLVDLVRKSVASHLIKAQGRVDLYEELQVW